VLRCLVALFILLSAPALAEKRIALVIGNGAYENVPGLANPRSDAELMATSLQNVGFQVTLITDANQFFMKTQIANFGRELRDGGPDTVGLFYYAGHGVQSRGANFLIPTDAKIQDPADLDLVGVEADWVLRQMESARNITNIVILDACRNNPFRGAGSLSNGLAEMDAPTGSFLSYATAPGSVAVDGAGSNSPFTSALANAIQTPGMPIEQVFKQVRVKVLEATGGRQTPWDASSLVSDFRFIDESKVDPMETLLWSSVKNTNDPEQLALFLEVYPDGAHAEEARGLLMAAGNEEETTQVQPPVVEPEKPAPTPFQAGPEETAMFDTAMKTLAREDLEAYLAAYPQGVFAALVEAEIANLPPADSGNEVAAVDPEQVTNSISDVSTPVANFTSPVVQGSPDIIGKSLEELVAGSPLFPPFEGIPEELWKGQQCTNCHHWTKEALCEQGTFYVTNGSKFVARKEHPYGGTFKANVKLWAENGCL
jgi:Caspase domain